MVNAQTAQILDERKGTNDERTNEGVYFWVRWSEVEEAGNEAYRADCHKQEVSIYLEL